MLRIESLKKRVAKSKIPSKRKYEFLIILKYLWAKVELAFYNSLSDSERQKIEENINERLIARNGNLKREADLRIYSLGTSKIANRTSIINEIVEYAKSW